MRRKEGGVFWPVKPGDSLSSIAAAAFGPSYHPHQLQQQIDHILSLNRSIIRDRNILYPGQLLYISKIQRFDKSEYRLSQDIWETNLVWQSLNTHQKQYVEDNWHALEALLDSLLDPVGFLSGLSEERCIKKLYEYIALKKPPPPELIIEVRTLITLRFQQLIEIGQREAWILLRETKVRAFGRFLIIFEDAAAITRYSAKLKLLKQLGQSLKWLSPRIIHAELGLAIAKSLAQTSIEAGLRTITTEGSGIVGSLLAIKMGLGYAAPVCRFGLGLFPATRLLSMTPFCDGFAATLSAVLFLGAMGSTAGRKIGHETFSALSDK